MPGLDELRVKRLGQGATGRCGSFGADSTPVVFCGPDSVRRVDARNGIIRQSAAVIRSSGRRVPEGTGGDFLVAHLTAP